MLPFIREEFMLDNTRAGWVLTAFNLSYGLSQIPAGWLADRIGPRVLITIGICGVAIVGIFIGISQTYTMLIILLVVMGLAGGGYHPSAIPLISASVNESIRGRALGVHQIGGSSSFFLVPLIAAYIAAAWGWRFSFIGLAIPTMIFGIVLYILLVRKKSTAITHAVEENTFVEETSSSATLRHLVAFIALSTFTHVVAHSIISFIPLYMVDDFNWSMDASAAFLSIFNSTGILVSLLGGYLSDRFGAVRVVVVISLLGGIAIYLLNIISSGVLVGVMTFVIGMVVHIRMVASSAYIVSETPSRHKSSVFGVYFAVMQSNALLSPVVGMLTDRMGYGSTFMIAGAATVAFTIICTIFFRGNRKRLPFA